MTSVIIHTEQLYHDQQVPIDYLIKKKTYIHREQNNSGSKKKEIKLKTLRYGMSIYVRSNVRRTYEKREHERDPDSAFKNHVWSTYH